MPKTKLKEYTADDLQALKKRLAENRDKLQKSLPQLVKRATDFKAAVELRDASQFLVSTFAAFDKIDTQIELAAHGRLSSSLSFSLASCGLEEA